MDFVEEPRQLSLQLVGGHGHYESVIEAVKRAELSVWIATANLKELMVEHRPGVWSSILDVFDDLAARGIELRLLHSSLPSRPFRKRFDSLERLVNGGLDLRLCPRVHFKTVIVDATTLYLGSANWTGAGLGAKKEGNRNFELGIITRDDAFIDQVQSYFEKIWNGSACPKCRRRDLCDFPLDER